MVGGKVFSDQSEPVKRELRAYIEDWGKLSMKKNDQRTHTCLLAKHIEISLYDNDFGSRYSIKNDKIHFVKGDRYALIGNLNHPDGTSTDHEYSCIYDEFFDIILETDHTSDIIVKVIHKEPSFSSLNSNSVPDQLLYIPNQIHTMKKIRCTLSML